MTSSSVPGQASRSLQATNLSNAVTAVLTAGLPGQAKAPRSALDAVIGARIRPAAMFAPVNSAAYSSALVWAWLHSGHPTEAVNLADRDVMAALRRVAGEAQTTTQSASYAVLAEAYLLNGRLRESAQCGRFALEYAREAQDEGCRFRALGLLAATFALSGEIAAAADAATEAAELATTQGWLEEQSSWPLMLGLVLIRSRAANVAGIEQVCDALDRCSDDDVVVRAVARFCTVVLLAVRQENQQVVSAARLIAQGADARLSPPFIIDMAIAMESIAHVHLGDPGAALGVVSERESPPDHSVCYELNKATIYLQLGELRKALAVTEGCVKGNPDHNLGTLASVQLRRALAYEGLGMHTQADAEYSKASHLAFEIGAVSAALGLPMEVMNVMFGRLLANEPAFGAQLIDHLPGNYQYPDRPPLDFEPKQLTSREQVLAQWLFTELTLPAIAAELHVSTNTVKSQIRTLYRKLDVSSRAEAVLQLERTGLRVQLSARAPHRLHRP